MSDVEEKIREAVLEKAKREAEKIITDARREAERIIAKAREEWERKRSQLRRQILENAKRRAEEIIIDAKIRARMKVTEAKKEVVEEVLRRIEEIVKEGSYDRKTSLERLLLEALKPFEGEVRIYVAEKDLDTARELSKKVSDKVKITNIETASILGGVIVESLDKTTKVDNSYEARIELLRSRLIPLIQRDLFGEQKP